MTSLINADTSGGLTLTSDTSGALDIQSAGTTKIAMDSSGNVDIVGTVTGAAAVFSGTATLSTGSNSFAHLSGTVYFDGGVRALNTNYTNSAAYDKVIYVSVSNTSASALLITVLDTSTIYGSVDPSAGAYYSATFIWPAGKVININMNGGPTLVRWVEFA
jgi:hypothetical protein